MNRVEAHPFYNKEISFTFSLFIGSVNLQYQLVSATIEKLYERSKARNVPLA